MVEHTWNITNILRTLKRIKEITSEEELLDVGYMLCGAKSAKGAQGELHQLIMDYLYIIEKTHQSIYAAFGDVVERIEREYEK